MPQAKLLDRGEKMIKYEIEKKTLLSEAQYKTLLGNFADKSIKDTIQINYYYDTENNTFLNNNETLRVRQINDGLELQFKYDKNIQDTVRVSKEFCKKIHRLPKLIMIDNLVANYIGSLLTERKRKIFATYTVCLDKNYYIGKVDYEMEVEVANISDMPIELFGVTFNTNCIGKYTRFANELIKQEVRYEISR